MQRFINGLVAHGVLNLVVGIKSNAKYKHLRYNVYCCLHGVSLRLKQDENGDKIPQMFGSEFIIVMHVRNREI